MFSFSPNPSARSEETGKKKSDRKEQCNSLSLFFFWVYLGGRFGNEIKVTLIFLPLDGFGF